MGAVPSRSNHMWAGGRNDARNQKSLSLSMHTKPFLYTREVQPPMNHAGAQALDALEDVLATLLVHTDRTEKKRGISYPKPRAFVHLHEGPYRAFHGNAYRRRIRALSFVQKIGTFGQSSVKVVDQA